MTQKKPLNKKLYFTLLILSVISIIAVLPYAFTLQADIIKLSPLPISTLAIVSIIQSTILFALAIYLGLKLSSKVGLGLPILEKYLNKEKLPTNLKLTVFKSVLLGILAGALIILLDFVFKYFGVSISLATNQIPPLWQRLLGSLYGGIAEEILLRLFLMSLIVWLFSKIKKYQIDITKNNFVMWFSIILAAIIFGLGHLPITSNITDLTTLIVLRAIILNGIGGIIFGWLYWKKGLESAMIAHLSADIIILAIFPGLMSLIK
ncbi:CPBP family intramembrane metalloprotease [Patescibacteria group bacterium]|nr:CPBP family intramembrane metalloprotease [Patescibacteria group bacterium]